MDLGQVIGGLIDLAELGFQSFIKFHGLTPSEQDQEQFGSCFKAIKEFFNGWEISDPKYVRGTTFKFQFIPGEKVPEADARKLLQSALDSWTQKVKEERPDASVEIDSFGKLDLSGSNQAGGFRATVHVQNLPSSDEKWVKYCTETLKKHIEESNIGEHIEDPIPIGQDRWMIVFDSAKAKNEDEAQVALQKALDEWHKECREENKGGDDAFLPKIEWFSSLGE